MAPMLGINVGHRRRGEGAWAQREGRQTDRFLRHHLPAFKGPGPPCPSWPLPRPPRPQPLPRCPGERPLRSLLSHTDPLTPRRPQGAEGEPVVTKVTLGGRGGRTGSRARGSPEGELDGAAGPRCREIGGDRGAPHPQLLISAVPGPYPHSAANSLCPWVVPSLRPRL